MRLFCFVCGDHQTGAIEDGCDCILLDNLAYMAIEPDEESSLDFSMFYPANYGLIINDGEDFMIQSTGKNLVYSLSNLPIHEYE